MAQQGVEKVGVDKHNLARTGRMALYGGGKSIAPFWLYSRLIVSPAIQLSSALQRRRGLNSSNKG